MSTFHAYVDAAHFHEALGNVLRFAAKRSRLLWRKHRSALRMGTVS